MRAETYPLQVLLLAFCGRQIAALRQQVEALTKAVFAE